MCVVGVTETKTAIGGGGATPSVDGDVAAVSEPLLASTCVEATFGTIRLARDPLKRSNCRGKYGIFSLVRIRMVVWFAVVAGAPYATDMINIGGKLRSGRAKDTVTQVKYCSDGCLEPPG